MIIHSITDNIKKQIGNLSFWLLIFVILFDPTGTILHKKDLMSLLNIKERKYYKFIKECTDAGIIKIDENDRLYISKDYFSKGKCEIPKYKQRIKIFCSSIRNLKLNENNSGKKFMANIYKLIPYIGDEFNILYDNSSGYKNPMSIKDVLKKLGYLSNKYVLREKNKLLNSFANKV